MPTLPHNAGGIEQIPERSVAGVCRQVWNFSYAISTTFDAISEEAR